MAIQNGRELVLSVSIHDCEVQTFRAGGKGGQAQNKKSTGVRVIHRPSGAVGEARDSRSQHQNKRNAFLRCVKSPEFEKWRRMRVSYILGQDAIIEQEVKNWMRPSNLRVEIKKDGKWKQEFMCVACGTGYTGKHQCNSY